MTLEKKIIFITFFLLLVLFLFNYKALLGSYYFNNANSKYIEKNYSGAIDDYDKSMKYMTGSQIDFNKGNSFYRIGEKQEDINKKIQYYSKSLNQYSIILDRDKAINRSEDPDVRYNYDFVKNKLEELQKQQEEQEEQEKQEKQNSQDENEEKQNNSQNQDNKGEQDNQGEQEKQDSQGNNEEQNSNEENKSGGQQKELNLTPEEMQQVEQYVQSLKNEEKYNREYYNNVKPEQTDPFFDSVFDRGSDKDR